MFSVRFEINVYTLAIAYGLNRLYYHILYMGYWQKNQTASNQGENDNAVWNILNNPTNAAEATES